MARYNSSFPQNTTSGTATLNSPNAGVFTKFTGSTTYIVTIPDPVQYQGILQTFYNANTSSVTISTPTGTFVGPGSSGLSTQSVPPTTTITLASDGANYVIVSEDGGPLIATTVNASSTVTLSPANANVTLSPTGTGVVTINPATLGAIDNVTIGGNSAKGATFTTLVLNTSMTGSGYIDGGTF